MKRQKRTVGAVVKIPFDGKWFTYGQILNDAEVVIFDARTDFELSTDEITNRPIICRVAVSYHAITKGRWLKVGKCPIGEELKKPIPKYIQDILQPDRFEIYFDGIIRPSTREECIGLERAAVWEPEHVEERIRDHYSGKQNRWVDILQ
jgi:hypothetical protein